MNSVMRPTFSSPIDFCVRLLKVLKLPLFITTLRRIDPVLREKILLTVSMTNQCRG